jgi:hypothetical protein
MPTTIKAEHKTLGLPDEERVFEKGRVDLVGAHRDRLAAHLDASARAPFLAYARARLESTKARDRIG